ncbi:FHA domain-containing protein [Actinomycetospora soli]|uniref:FHA domain-containing protein n=1 Tax=Actinomycetospora soli TaxID=2893887 RepID=UPI001E4B4468|nr:FHA domain-containing protein [Actinomycetospora soli]MCD2187855.1 FHA domain-containing protein [Actinomycetospora soli]
MAELTCPACGQENPPGVVLCLACFSNLDPGEPAPPPPTTNTPRATCSDCGGALSSGGTCLPCRVEVDAGRAEPSAAAPPKPTQTRRESAALVLDVAGQAVTVSGSVLLGRQDSPVAAALASSDNVSRRHATIRVDIDGSVWIRDEHSANGTFVSGRRLAGGQDEPLRPGDSLRLASDVEIGLRWGGTR